MPTPKKSADTSATIQASLETSADEIFGGEAVAPVAVPAEPDEKAVDDKPADEKAVDDKPADEKPADEKPADEKPADEKPADEKPADEKPADEKPADDKPADEKPADEADLYKTPEGISKRAGERFEKLVTALKTKDTVIAEKDTVIAEQAKEVKLYNEVLASTGLSGDEAVRMIEMGAMIKHDPVKAVEVMQKMTKSMAQRLGITLPGVDLLEGHADLQQRVADREITQKDAEDLAKARITQSNLERSQAQEQQRRQEQDRQKQDQGAFVAKVEDAKSQVAAYLTTKVKDPDWPKIAPYLAEAASFAGKNLAPEKWMDYIKGEHKRIVAISLAARGSQTPTPIVETHRNQGGAKTPTTLDELADQLL